MNLYNKYELNLELYYDNYRYNNMFNILIRYYTNKGRLYTDNITSNASNIICKYLTILLDLKEYDDVNNFGLINIDINKHHVEQIEYMCSINTKYTNNIHIRNTKGLNGILYTFLYDDLNDLILDFDYRLNMLEKAINNKKFELENILG